jgi:hypothetical protein
MQKHRFFCTNFAQVFTFNQKRIAEVKELNISTKSKLKKTVRINMLVMLIYSTFWSIFMFIATFSETDQFSHKNLGDWFVLMALTFFIQFLINFIKCIVYFCKKNYELGKVYLFNISLLVLIFIVTSFSLMIIMEY